MIYVWLIVSFWIVVAIVAYNTSPVTVVSRNLRRGNVERAVWLNAYRSHLVCEIYFKDGSSLVMNVQFGSKLYFELRPYLTKVPMK